MKFSLKFSPNGLLAVEPFPSNQLQHTARAGGRLVIASKSSLVPLKVVYAGGNVKDTIYMPGDIVWVRSDVAMHEWAKLVFCVEKDGEKDVDFILMPISFIQLAQKEE